MAYYYLLTVANKQSARNLLKQLDKQITNRSSSYHINNHSVLYIVLDFDAPLPSLPSNEGWQLIPCQEENIPKTSQELLINWAISEIEQSLAYINYESLAKSIDAGCQIHFGDQIITHSYHPLTELMLIINNTPDSFSEQGKLYQRLDATLNTIENALKRGVNIIDVGGESTRPGALAVSTEEEIARLNPLIDEIVKLKKHHNFKLSLDSYKEATINKFLDNIDIVNDVSGNLDPVLLSEIARRNLTYLPMHSLTVPVDKTVTLPQDQDPVTLLTAWGYNKLDLLYKLGFKKEQIILDIGIGFNKTQAQSWFLLKNISRFSELGIELLVGHSRKSFLSKVCSKFFSERDLETAIISGYLSQSRVDYLRIHNLDYWEQIRNINNQLYTNQIGLKNVSADSTR